MKEIIAIIHINFIRLETKPNLKIIEASYLYLLEMGNENHNRKHSNLLPYCSCTYSVTLRKFEFHLKSIAMPHIYSYYSYIQTIAVGLVISIHAVKMNSVP